MKLTDGERLAVVENEVHNVKNEIKEVKTLVRDGFTALEAKMDHVSNYYVTKDEFLRDMANLRSKRWTENTLSAVVGAFLTGVVGYVLLAIFSK